MIKLKQMGGRFSAMGVGRRWIGKVKTHQTFKYLLTAANRFDGIGSSSTGKVRKCQE